MLLMIVVERLSVTLTWTHAAVVQMVMETGSFPMDLALIVTGNEASK